MLKNTTDMLLECEGFLEKAKVKFIRIDVKINRIKMKKLIQKSISYFKKFLVFGLVYQMLVSKN